MKKLGLVSTALLLVLGITQCKQPALPVNSGGTLDTKTISFTTNGAGSKGLITSVGALLKYKWNEDTDRMYVYIQDGGTSFTDGSYIGSMKITNLSDDKYTATFSGSFTAEFPNEGWIRLVHCSPGITINADGSMAVASNFSSQDGTLETISGKIISFCDFDYDENSTFEFGNKNLVVQFGIAIFSFENFDGNKVKMIGGEGKTSLKLLSNGTCEYLDGTSSTLNWESSVVKNNYYTVIMPTTGDGKKTFFFTDDKNVSRGGLKIEAGKFYSKSDGEHATGDPVVMTTNVELIPGGYSVSADKVVRFTKGNLYYDGTEFKFENYQCDNRTVYKYSKYARINKAETSTPSGNWGLFGWSTASTTYGMSYSSNNSDYSGDFKDWGTAFGNVYHTLSKDEWQYLLGCNGVAAYRPDATEKRKFKSISFDGTSVKGLVILPDNVDKSKMSEISSSADLVTYNAVFLPGVRNRNVNGLWGNGNDGHYWTSTLVNSYDAYGLYTSENSIGVGESYEQGHPESGRQCGYAVRLVCNAE